MFRNVIFAVTLGGVLAAAQPVFADPLASAAAEHAQVAAPATKQTASTAATVSSSSSSIVNAPARSESQEDAPVGFGWG